MRFRYGTAHAPYLYRRSRSGAATIRACIRNISPSLLPRPIHLVNERNVALHGSAARSHMIARPLLARAAAGPHSRKTCGTRCPSAGERHARIGPKVEMSLELKDQEDRSVELNRYKKPESEQNPAPKTRNCLICRSPFQSAWSGERVCQRCKTTTTWRSG